MSVRGVWLLSLPVNDSGRLLFSRVFPTVEKRAQALEKESYVPLPDSSSELVDSLYGSLGINQPSTGFVKSRDSCSRLAEKPVWEVRTSGGTLWPLLVIEQCEAGSCVAPATPVWLPLLLPSSGGTGIFIPGVSAGFSLLLGMADFMGTLPRHIEETSPKLVELSLFLSQAAPFGSPVDVNSATVKMAIHGKAGPMPPKNQKQPAWKPGSYKGKGQIHFTIKEIIRAVQYDKPDIPDVWDVYGTVTCRAELEGQMPDVSVTLSHMEEVPVTPAENLLLHPCVQNTEPHTQRAGFHRLRFSPPLENFKLCHYTANNLAELPIKGYYQMKGGTSVDVLVQLKLSDHLRNNFEYCELQLPFFRRGPVLHYDASPSHGNVLLSPDKRILVWNIGQKFPSKSLEVLLKASLQFGSCEQVDGSRMEEQFCSGSNAYAQLLFKMSEFTHTGITIDPKNIQVSPATKFKATTVREYSTNDYKIWNSHGEVLSAYVPPEDLIS